MNATQRTLSEQYSSATANGSNWYPTTYADEMMIRLLFPLICKSTSSVASIGNSLTTLQQTGLLSAKGYFYGTNSSSASIHGQKFLGMENMWGSLWRQCVGAINYGSMIYIKLTPSQIDGTSTIGFSTSTYGSDYSGYIKMPYATNTTEGKNIQKVSADPFLAFIPEYASGTGFNSLYYCDYLWWTRSSSSIFAVLFGGEFGLTDGSAGIFATGGNIDPDTRFAKYSASISYHFY